MLATWTASFLTGPHFLRYLNGEAAITKTSVLIFQTVVYSTCHLGVGQVVVRFAILEKENKKLLEYEKYFNILILYIKI